MLAIIFGCTAHRNAPPPPPERAVAPARSPCTDGTIAVTGGCVRGTQAGAVRVFRGIPYAAAPVGARRWQPPAAVVPWRGARDASEFGKACPQLDDTIGGKLEQSEDCLTLNVWAAAATRSPRPVMVWIHGGGLVQGGSAVPAYDGQHLARDGDVVVVSIQYRLGPLGFLAHPALSAEDADHHASGNYGLMDQIAALAWVRANIAAFGGDPANVTIFGESAGGESVCALMASPRAAGLFARAIIESAQCVAVNGKSARALRGASAGESAEAQGTRIASALGCAGDDAAAAACLRGKSVAELVHARPAALGFLASGEHYGLVIDGAVLDAAPRELLDAGKLANVPTLVGTTADEATLFTAQTKLVRPLAFAAIVAKLFPGRARDVLARYPVDVYGSPKAAFDALVTDFVFGCPTRHAARALRARQPHVYRYLFAHVTAHAKYRALGATHGSEIPYVFGTLADATADELVLSRAMLAYWAQFAHTGEPSAPDAPAWPAYAVADDPYLELQTPIAARARLRADECDLLDALAMEAVELRDDAR